MHTYPVHNLAPDPHQLELPLRPPDKPRPDYHARASPARRVFCHYCGSVHASQSEVLACKAGR
jgi:hypothetical protein